MGGSVSNPDHIWYGCHVMSCDSPSGVLESVDVGRSGVASTEIFTRSYYSIIQSSLAIIGHGQMEHFIMSQTRATGISYNYSLHSCSTPCNIIKLLLYIHVCSYTAVYGAILAEVVGGNHVIMPIEYYTSTPQHGATQPAW